MRYNLIIAPNTQKHTLGYYTMRRWLTLNTPVGGKSVSKEKYEQKSTIDGWLGIYWIAHRRALAKEHRLAYCRNGCITFLWSN